jgi:hypothetical protein
VANCTPLIWQIGHASAAHQPLIRVDDGYVLCRVLLEARDALTLGLHQRINELGLHHFVGWLANHRTGWNSLQSVVERISEPDRRIVDCSQRGVEASLSKPCTNLPAAFMR